MKNDIYLTLERYDSIINDDLEFSEDGRWLETYADAHFDVDKKFGLNTKEHEGSGVRLCIRYNPIDKELKVGYVLTTDKDYIEKEYIPTEKERGMFIYAMEEACVNWQYLTCYDAVIRNYFKNTDDVSLICEKTADGMYQIRNRADDFVIYKEDGLGILKDYVGHELIYTTHKDDYDYSYEIRDLRSKDILLTQTEEPIEILDYEQTEFVHDKYKLVVFCDYKKAMLVDDIPKEIRCNVYTADDKNYEHNLGSIKITKSLDFDENSVQSIETALKNKINEHSNLFQITKENMVHDKTELYLARAVSYIAELTGMENLRETMTEKLDMSENEADEVINRFGAMPDIYQGMNLG